MEKIISVKDLSITLNKNKILKNITFPIYKNKITSIIGPSGCGKSTLLKCLSRGLDDVKGDINGEILFENENIFSKDNQYIRKNIGLIFQTPSPFPFSTYKNMTYALEYFGIKDKKLLKKSVVENLKKAGLYEEVKNKLNIDARNLSGGQQQRLCIARSLTVNPKVLLLDEPCSSLDIKNTYNIENMLKELKKDYTVVIVTHNLSQAKRISDYTLFIENGSLIEFDKANNIFNNSKEERTLEYIQYMGG